MGSCIGTDVQCRTLILVVLVGGKQISLVDYIEYLKFETIGENLTKRVVNELM